MRSATRSNSESTEINTHTELRAQEHLRFIREGSKVDPKKEVDRNKIKTTV